MKTTFRSFASLRLCGTLLLLAFSAAAQTIPAPKDTLGFTPGDDRKLASWAQVVDYFQKLDKASDRMTFEEIGKTTMGAPFVFATISSPENLKTIDKYKQINAKLADPRLIKSSDAAANALIKQGKTIVLITCGVHSTEVGSYLSSMLIAYKLASATDPETKKILDNTIILLVPSLNPDGVDIVNNWYQKTLGTPYEGTEPPELYHKYVGHDNNRDWYAFTQVETQLTVDKIHNVWHPQIVHDIHQQGANGSRLFLPPYMQPVEPNVPKQIVEGYTELGNAMAADLRKQGFQGITTNSTYDAWTPARAYSHYHGGVRILSETASAKLATPITVKWEDIRGGEGYDARKESPNFGPVWKGGEWHIGDITNYITSAAFSLLNHAADNREKWLTNFYAIGKEAVRPRKKGQLFAYLFDIDKAGGHFASDILPMLKRAGVEIDQDEKIPFSVGTKRYDRWTDVIRMDQPYSGFAKAVIDPMIYPDLRDKDGNPIPPYDVTAHSLSLLIDDPFESIFEPFSYRHPRPEKGSPGAWASDAGPPCEGKFEYRTYHSDVPSMDEGWTRWVFLKYGRLSTINPTKNYCVNNHGSIFNHDFRNPIIGVDAIIFPDQSRNQILNGYAKGSMPDEYTGGVGKEGVENLRKFVEAGGTLVFLNRSSDFAIEQFNLPIRDVTKGLARKDFYIPGSILRTELDLTSPIAKGMPKESIAWFENSPAFEIVSVPPAVAGGVVSAEEKAPPTTVGGTDAIRVIINATAQAEPPASTGGRDSSMFNVTSGPSADGFVLPYAAPAASAAPPAYAGGSASVANIRIIARYPTDPKQILLSGWALGAEKIAGKAALVQINIGKGKIILFGFRPQYRGQSLATFPLLFNAITN